MWVFVARRVVCGVIITCKLSYTVKYRFVFLELQIIENMKIYFQYISKLSAYHDLHDCLQILVVQLFHDPVVESVPHFT